MTLHPAALRALFAAGALALGACGGAVPGNIDPKSTSAASVCEAYTGPALSALTAWQGAEHNHSDFSDGDPGYIPADYYAAGREHGLDFMIGSEHSENLDDGNYVTLSEECLVFDPAALDCINNPTPDKLINKWEAIQRMADEAAAPGYLTTRGFEYSPDRFGHINVLFSTNFTNYLWDASYVGTMELFWQWFLRDPELPGLGGSPTSTVPFGGGGDGIAIFNHPGDKCNLKDYGDAGCNWNGFAYVPAADERMVGIETFNTDNGRDYYYQHMIEALDQGWHVGSVGAEDLHHPLWGQPQLSKTVILAPALTQEALKEAMLARRMYSLAYTDAVRLDILADGQHPMGARLQCAAGAVVDYSAAATNWDGSPFTGKLELIGPQGAILAAADGGLLSAQLPVEGAERWYFLRVTDAEGRGLAYSSPVWIKPKT